MGGSGTRERKRLLKELAEGLREDVSSSYSSLRQIFVVLVEVRIEVCTQYISAQLTLQFKMPKFFVAIVNSVLCFGKVYCVYTKV